jgi:SAM-dependent methyltransferase
MFYTTYCEEYYAGMGFTPKFLNELNYLLPHLSECKSVVDLGAGTGRSVQLLTEVGFKAFGIDSSPPAVQLAQTAGILVTYGDVRSTNIPDESFDAAISVHVLEHIKDFKAVIAESVRLSSKVAAHLVPLGKRDDPTHHHLFNSIRDVYIPIVNRTIRQFTHKRIDGKCFGILTLGKKS